MPKTSRKTGRRGRPPIHEGQSKRASFNTRLTPSLKAWLEKRAAENGRSLSEEIEHRLHQSRSRDEEFATAVRETVLKDIEQSFGGAQSFNTMQIIGAAAAHIERTTGRSWLEDAETREHVRGAFNELLNMLAPPPTGALFALGAIAQGGRPELGKEALLKILQQRISRRRLAAALAGEPSDGERPVNAMSESSAKVVEE